MSEYPPTNGPPTPPTGPPGLPWEASEAGFGSLLPTIAGFVARPIESFTRMSLSVDLVRPLAYYVIVVLFGTGMNLLWSLLFFRSVANFVRLLAPNEALRAQMESLLKAPTGIGLVLQFVVTPFIALIVLFVWAAIVHVVLVLLGGARNGFATSLRVLCYARTSALAQVIPIVGGLVAVVWELAMQIAGLAEAHRAEGWKAALAVLLPIVVCCSCIVLAVALFGAAMLQAIQQQT